MSDKNTKKASKNPEKLGKTSGVLYRPTLPRKPKKPSESSQSEVKRPVNNPKQLGKESNMVFHPPLPGMLKTPQMPSRGSLSVNEDKMPPEDPLKLGKASNVLFHPKISGMPKKPSGGAEGDDNDMSNNKNQPAAYSVAHQPPFYCHMAERNYSRLGKCVICCEDAPELVDVNIQKCTCELYSCGVYDSSYGYAPSAIYDQRARNSSSVGWCCMPCGVCKLCSLYFCLNLKCCCWSLCDNRVYGCGEKYTDVRLSNLPARVLCWPLKACCECASDGNWNCYCNCDCDCY